MVIWRQLLLCCWIPYLGSSTLFYFKDNTEQRKKYSYVTPCVLLNLLFLLPPWMKQLLVRKWVTPDSNSKNTTRLFRELALCLALFEIFFYYAHRITHKFEFLFKNIHAVHHQLREPIGFGALYVHPIEFIMCNLIPMSIGPIVLQTPLMNTLKIWLCLANVFIVATHSGHIPNKHLEHHLTLKGTYGTTGFLDWINHT